MIIQLNKNYSIILCGEDDEALNARDFVALDEWAIKHDGGERYAPDSRYTYTTLFAKKRKLYFKCGNAKAAIQQAILEALKKSPVCKLSNTWFKIIPSNAASR